MPLFREYVWQIPNSKASELLPIPLHQQLLGASQGGLNVPEGAGKRLIVNGIGSEFGFIQDALENFQGQKDSGDYHSEMNAKHFENWWVEKVLPNLAPRSVVVIDNAS